ncbi:MAG: STAS domain-containing protein [Rikenellaceae bacterium]
MNVTIEKTEQGCVISINGRLDTITSNQFEIEVRPALEMEAKEIVLDCRDLAYISSSGLRQFLMIRKMSTIKGANVIVTNLSEDIRKTFEITGFNELFEIR